MADNRPLLRSGPRVLAFDQELALAASIAAALPAAPAALNLCERRENFLGGFVAIAAYYVLNIAPSLATLSLIVFLIGMAFGLQIVKGGVRGGNRNESGRKCQSRCLNKPIRS